MILYRIQHHPSRDISELLARLPEAEVITDEISPWSGYQVCLTDLPSAVTHVAVLQDDVLLCRDFREKVERVIEKRPENVISLFVGGLGGPTKMAFHEAMRKGESFSVVNSTRIVHVVGMIWPRHLAESILAWVEENKIPGPKPPRSDDASVGFWSLRTNNQILATVPSLVEHPDLESIVNPRRAKAGRDRGRVAIHFLA